MRFVVPARPFNDRTGLRVAGTERARSGHLAKSPGVSRRCCDPSLWPSPLGPVLGLLSAPTGDFASDAGWHLATAAMLLMGEMPFHPLVERRVVGHPMVAVPFGVELRFAHAG